MPNFGEKPTVLGKEDININPNEEAPVENVASEGANKEIAEGAAEGNVEAKEEKSLMEIGAERRSAIIDGAKSKWDSLKGKMSSGMSWLKKKGLNVIDATLAAPEAVSEGAKKTGQKISETGQYIEDRVAQGAEFVANKATAGIEKTAQGVEYAGQKVAQGAEFVTDKAAAGIDKTAKGVEFLADKTKEGYEALKNKGSAAYENLQAKLSNTKNKFNDWRNERRLSRLAEKEAKQAEKVQKYMKKLEEVRQKRASFTQRDIGAGI